MKYNITDFGAKIGDCLQTKQIQAAIDKCFLDGGGEVIIPEGIFRTGGLRLRSNVTLHLLSGAVLEGSDNPADYTDYINDTLEPIDLKDQWDERRSVYPYSNWNNAVIRAIYAENIAVIGEENSYIDGVDCYDENGEENYRGPHGINIQSCKNITLKGYKIRRSANWAHAIFRSSNIKAENISVYGGHDGFDVRTCDNITVENCGFYTGDDCIAGFDNKNVIIRNCILNCACNALRFGGTDVLIEDCKIFSPGYFGHRLGLLEEEKKRRITVTEKCNHNMLTAFCYYCDFRADVRHTPGNILMRNCTIENPGILYYHEFGHIWAKNRELESFKMENCTVSGMTHPVVHYGDENSANMVLEFENIKFFETKTDTFIKAKKFKNILLKSIQFDDNVVREVILEDDSGAFATENSGEFSVNR